MGKYYTLDAIEQAKNNDTSYAKTSVLSQAKDITTYWVKRATSGPEAGHLLNPLSPNYTDGVDNKRTEARLGKKRYEYTQVTESVFIAYLHFLRTRNELYYRQADREAYHG
jgi:hypothetical protein